MFGSTLMRWSVSGLGESPLARGSLCAPPPEAPSLSAWSSGFSLWPASLQPFQTNARRRVCHGEAARQLLVAGAKPNLREFMATASADKSAPCAPSGEPTRGTARLACLHKARPRHIRIDVFKSLLGTGLRVLGSSRADKNMELQSTAEEPLSKAPSPQLLI